MWTATARPSTLRSTTPRSRAIYERHGFECIGEMTPARPSHHVADVAESPLGQGRPTWIGERIGVTSGQGSHGRMAIAGHDLGRRSFTVDAVSAAKHSAATFDGWRAPS